MQFEMNILNVSGGVIEDNSQEWANALTLDELDLHNRIEDKNIIKGIRPAKVGIDTSNNNSLVKRFALESFPAKFLVDVKTKTKAGVVALEIVNFKSNQK